MNFNVSDLTQSCPDVFFSFLLTAENDLIPEINVEENSHV